MELIEQRLRDCLHDWFMGENAPNNIIITRQELQYIKDHSKDIGEMVTIEFELDENLKNEASSIVSPAFFSFPLSESTKKSYKKFQGKCTIISEFEQKFSFQDYQKWQARNLNESNQEETKECVPTPILNYLLFTILEYKNLLEFDVLDYSSSFYNRTYKLELLLFNKKILSLTDDEIKLEYYKCSIPEEFKKLKYELGKYFENQDQKKHLSIIDFYIGKFSGEIDKLLMGSIKDCFVLINLELQNLRHDLLSYFGYTTEIVADPGKLVWTGTIDAFITFFEPLIDAERIYFQGTKNKYAIYKNLLCGIYFKNQPDLTIDTLTKILKITVQTSDKEIGKCKLTWNGSRQEFVKEFKSTFNRSITEKSLFIFQGANSLTAIAKKLHLIFEIKSQKRPEAFITEGSLIQAIKTI